MADPSAARSRPMTPPDPRTPRPDRPAAPPLPAIEALHDEHRAMLEHMALFDELVGHLLEDGADGRARELAARVRDFFDIHARAHHAEEERVVGRGFHVNHAAARDDDPKIDLRQTFEAGPDMTSPRVGHPRRSGRTELHPVIGHRHRGVLRRRSRPSAGRTASSGGCRGRMSQTSFRCSRDRARRGVRSFLRCRFPRASR